MLKIVLSIVVALACAATAELTDDCLACMCYVSSAGCVMPDPPCHQESWGVVCSPWGFTEPYWKDGGRLGGDFQTCGADWDCSEATVRGYLARYVIDSSATCETYARVHIGGPQGASASYTLDYWYDVRDCLDNGSFTPPPA
ncbi:lysozyme [Hyalella azteca]|uniref:lysozyme n=1 Tax=Hyalella azteca TaxID=294128 RepID=A0A8B7NWW6_HYAAZ|nr:lysozyme [Hyalella azteca]